MGSENVRARMQVLVDGVWQDVTEAGLPISLVELLNKSDEITVHGAPCDSKVSITASAQILSGPGILYGFKIVSFTDGATVRFSDALTATTPYLSTAQTISAALGYSADKVILFGGMKGIQMTTGCYVTITGTIELIPLVKLD